MEVILSKFSRINIDQSIAEAIKAAIEAAHPNILVDGLKLHLLNDLHPSIDREDFAEGGSVSIDQLTSNWTLEYPDPSQEGGVRRLQVRRTEYLDYGHVMARYVQEATCPEHRFIPDRHSSGTEYRDGRGVCEHCGYQRPGVLEQDVSSQLAKCSLSTEKSYPTANDWRDPDTGEAPYLQGGDSGIVISRETGDVRKTAFFEAFPDVGGFGTFIRGEGGSMREAEEHAWAKYQRYLACEGHEFSRTVNGTHRTDGCGTCVHCGLYSSSALPPETTCECCGTPTNNQIGERILCYTHFFEQVSFDEYVDAYYKLLNSGGGRLRMFEDRNEIAATRFFIFEMKKWTLKAYCQGDAVLLEQRKREVEYLARFLDRVYDSRHLDALRDSEGNCPDYDAVIRPHQVQWFEQVRASGLLDEQLRGCINPVPDRRKTSLSVEDFSAFS